MSQKKVSLTGVKPTQAPPHLGNYLGAIRPALRLADQFDGRYFIADYHALTSMRDPAALHASIYDVTATWLACGLDPKKTLLYRQSAIPEVFELAWILACVVATGQLERGHAYKAALDSGEAPNSGLLFYPVLMAADIVLFNTNVVPVGQDQKQHVELARDMAMRVNHLWGAGTLVVPEVFVSDAPLVPGLDGKKMSKSGGNSVPLFDDADALRRLVMKFTCGSEPLGAPKPSEGTPVFEIYKLVATDDEVKTMARKLAAGGYGWGHAKEDLCVALEREIGSKREAYRSLRADEAALDHVLAEGAAQARETARATMERVRGAVGIARS